MLFKKKRIKQNIPDELMNEFREADDRKEKQRILNKNTIQYSLSLSNKTINTAVKDIKETKLEPTFKDILFKYIDESGLKDPEVYKKAKVDKRTFSKIRNNDVYISQKTAICFGLALELSVEDFNKLLASNHYSLTNNDYFDVAIMWCIKNKIYDIEQVNDILYACDLSLLTK